MSDMLFLRGPDKKFRGGGAVKVDHATLNRWVINYPSSLALAAKSRKRTVATSWRMDETYIY
jgi:transposase-like protein